ncbi:kinase-like protein [Ceratobasidium sp. AG-I]|nr:kinase-like protein [Ceratobasidium sp. AG-I]
MRETHIWSKMKHENIQQLLGIVLFQGRLGMVSSWMDNGNLQEYIKANPHVDRYKLCPDVATGVAYLHSIKMVHGDIKALNVLVSQDGVAKLSDFDHSILSDYTSPFPATPNTGGGTLRWMAPELRPMPPEEDSFGAVRSRETDIYALGMTMLEIITGRVPYSEFKDDRRVVHAVDNNIKPIRPQELLGPSRRENQMWDLLTECWDRSPKNRPAAAVTLRMLQRLVINKASTEHLSSNA